MEQTLQQDREELLELITKDAYFQEKITLSSGKESDYYVDARLVSLQPKGAYLIAKLMFDMIKEDDINAIGGPTLGADPMIGAIGVVSLQAGRPLNNFIIRKEAKAHGKGKQIEGPALKEGDRVVIIDDVATGNVSISLSPEIPVSSFSLKQCFDNTLLNSDIRKQWASVLRDIAAELDE